jgi:predicted dehydrogenase
MALRWGICSAGKISHDFVVGLKSLPETEHQVVAVAARSLDSASANLPRITPSPDTMALTRNWLMIKRYRSIATIKVC